MSDRNERNADALQSDRSLRKWKVGAAVVSVAVLLGLTATSVARAPNDVWTIVLPLVAVAVVALVVIGLLRGRR